MPIVTISIAVLRDRGWEGQVQHPTSTIISSAAAGRTQTQRESCRIYLAHTKYINNWDLVDLSAPQIVGGYLESRSRKLVYRLAKSEVLGERRIAIERLPEKQRRKYLDGTIRERV